MSVGRKTLRRARRKHQKRIERDRKNVKAKAHRRAEHFGHKNLATVNRSLDDLLPPGCTFEVTGEKVRINMSGVPRGKEAEAAADIAKRLNIDPEHLQVTTSEQKRKGNDEREKHDAEKHEPSAIVGAEAR